MAIRTEAYIRANGSSCNRLQNVKASGLQWLNNEAVYQNIQLQRKHHWWGFSHYSKEELYSKYFDSQKTDRKTINDASQGKCSNCVDWGQVYYRIAKSLGYDVQFVHVKCRVSGTGHIRLRLRHKKHTGGNWINRDPATVADTTSGNVRAIWCEDGYLITYNPSWIFTDLYSS